MGPSLPRTYLLSPVNPGNEIYLPLFYSRWIISEQNSWRETPLETSSSAGGPHTHRNLPFTARARDGRKRFSASHAGAQQEHCRHQRAEGSLQNKAAPRHAWERVRGLPCLRAFESLKNWQWSAATWRILKIIKLYCFINIVKVWIIQVDPSENTSWSDLFFLGTDLDRPACSENSAA